VAAAAASSEPVMVTTSMPCLRDRVLVQVIAIIGKDDAWRGADDIGAAVPLGAFAHTGIVAGFRDAQLSDFRMDAKRCILGHCDLLPIHDHSGLSQVAGKIEKHGSTVWPGGCAAIVRRHILRATANAIEATSDAKLDPTTQPQRDCPPCNYRIVSGSK